METDEKTLIIKMLYDILCEASNHLDYINYGDIFQREFAYRDKLPGRIENCLRMTDKYLLK